VIKNRTAIGFVVHLMVSDAGAANINMVKLIRVADKRTSSTTLTLIGPEFA
jgi:hypothetical protein